MHQQHIRSKLDESIQAVTVARAREALAADIPRIMAGLDATQWLATLDGEPDAETHFSIATPFDQHVGSYIPYVVTYHDANRSYPMLLLAVKLEEQGARVVFPDFRDCVCHTFRKLAE